MRLFVLRRLRDVTGISGEGVVAEGALFSNGWAVLRWIGKWPSSLVVHESGIAGVEAVHGHEGNTVVEWVDGD